MNVLDSREMTDAVAFMIDLESGEATRMTDTTLASAGFGERKDLQRWITAYPEIVGSHLLLVTSEFDQWEVRDQKVADRFDALFLDTSGSPVVAELKRDRATDTVELQALKYAAYCSQLTLDDVIEQYADYHDADIESARQRVVEHAPSVEDAGLKNIRIRLVAGSFGPAVTSVVLWLRDYGIDIGCIEVAVRQVPGARQATLVARQLLPLPEAEDYLVRRRRKEQEEDRVRTGPAEWSWEAYSEKFPSAQVAIARELFNRITSYVQERGLSWTPALRAWWLGYQRPGGYYVPVIQILREKPIEFAVKLPDDPRLLGIKDPFPELESSWNESNRQWTWQIPSLDAVPDLRLALDISASRQPESGPMPRTSDRV